MDNETWNLKLTTAKTVRYDQRATAVEDAVTAYHNHPTHDRLNDLLRLRDHFLRVQDPATAATIWTALNPS